MKEFKTIGHKVNSFMNEVRKIGVRAEKKWTCCQSCGHTEMEDTPNYIFYHMQTAYYMKETKKCFFAYYFSNEDIKEKVKQIANSYGSNWNGSNNETIIISL